MQLLKEVKNQPPLSPFILTLLIHFPQFQLLVIFLANQNIPFYSKLPDFVKLNTQLGLQILVIAQLCVRLFIITILCLRQFVLTDKKSSVEILVLKFLKVKIKVLVVMSLYWNFYASLYLASHYLAIAIINILVTILELYGTRILNSSFRFEEENLICQKNSSLFQYMLLFPITYLINYQGLFYASCLIIVRCFVQMYENFNNIENRAIQYCDYFSPLLMLSFCLIEIMGHFLGIQLLNNGNVLFFALVLIANIYGANCITETLIVLVPKYHLRKCTYFTKNQDKPSLLQTEGTLHVSESQEESFIVALRVLAKVYITKQKMEGLFVVRQNPYHGSVVRQDQFDQFWLEFNKIIINHRIYCVNVTCSCMKRLDNPKQNSQISSALFMEIMFSSLQKVLASTNSTKLAIIEKYFYIELLQKPIKNYYLLVKLKDVVKKSEQILEVDLLMSETRQMLGHLLNKGKARNQHIQIEELIGFQKHIKKMKQQFIQLSSSYKSFYDIFHNSFVEIPVMKKSTQHLIELKRLFRIEIDDLMPKFFRNIEFLSYCLIYFTYFEEYTEDAEKIRTKINNFNELSQLEAQSGANAQAKNKQKIDVFDPIYGAIKIDLVWRPGEIISATRNVCQMLGFKMDQTEGENVTKLMPSMFGRFHDRSLRRFVQKGSINMVRLKEKIFFAKNFQKFILPITVKIKVQYLCSESFCASSLVRKTATKSQFILLNNYGKIEQVSQSLYRLLFQKSLKEDVSKIKRINVYKMLLSLNHFIKNPQQMDERIYEGIITTTENEDLMYSFYRNIDVNLSKMAQQSMLHGSSSSFGQQQASIAIKSQSSTKRTSPTGQLQEGMIQNEPTYDAEKCCTSMMQMLKDYYGRIDLDQIKAYRVMYKFYDLVTSDFVCKVLEIVSIKEEITPQMLLTELPKEMVEIGELYGMSEEQINKVKKLQMVNKSNQLNQSIEKGISQSQKKAKGAFNNEFAPEDATNNSRSRKKGQTEQVIRDPENAGSVGSSLASNAQKNLRKFSIINSFSLSTNINKTFEIALTGSMLLASSFLIIICIFSTTIKPDYENFQRDNSVISNFMINFESRLALQELFQFYDSFSMDAPTSLAKQKKILTDTMKTYLQNAIQFTDNDISDQYMISQLTLKNIQTDFSETRSTIATLSQIYSVFLMREDQAEHLSNNYQVIRTHLQDLSNQEKGVVLKSSQSLRFKIDAIVGTYGLTLVVLIALLFLINRQSIQQEQKIMDFLPFVNKKLVREKINFYEDFFEYLKQNEEIFLSQIESIQQESTESFLMDKTNKKQSLKVKQQNLLGQFLQSNQKQVNSQSNGGTKKKKTGTDSKFIHIVKGNEKSLTVQNGILLFLMVGICLAVIIQTDYFFIQAHKKFMAYINLKELALMLQNLAPRTLLTYLINIDKIISSQQLIAFPDYFYQAPIQQIFDIRIYLSQPDVDGTDLANNLNQHLNTQICSLIQCDPNQLISKQTDVYFLAYRFINALEYLRKIWTSLQVSGRPREKIRAWIQEGNVQNLLKTIEQILELMRINEKKISDLFTEQINTIGYQLLYFSLTLIPLLILSMYFLREKFISFVYERLGSLEDTYKQFSWKVLSENTYALNYFENKLRQSKKY